MTTQLCQFIDELNIVIEAVKDFRSKCAETDNFDTYKNCTTLYYALLLISDSLNVPATLPATIVNAGVTPAQVQASFCTIPGLFGNEQVMALQNTLKNIIIRLCEFPEQAYFSKLCV